MKKIVTLILALGTMTAVFAQSGDRGHWSGNQEGGQPSYYGNVNRSYQGYNNNYYGNNNRYYDGGSREDRYDRGERRSYGYENGYGREGYSGWDHDGYRHRGWYSMRPERHFRERFWRYERNW